MHNKRRQAYHNTDIGLQAKIIIAQRKRNISFNCSTTTLTLVITKVKVVVTIPTFTDKSNASIKIWKTVRLC